MRERGLIYLIASGGFGVLTGLLICSALTPPCPDCQPCAVAATCSSGGETFRSPSQSHERPVSPGKRRADRSEIDSLRQQIAALEEENERLKELDLDTDARYYGFSAAELELLARNCEVRADQPPTVVTDSFIDAIKAQPEERVVIERVISEFHDLEAARKRALVVEVGADLDEYDSLDWLNREFFFVNQFSSDDPQRQREIQRMMAEEKAGLRMPPTHAELAGEELYVRFLRGLLSPGDRFAEALAHELGEARVHELRAAAGGWPGGRRRQTGCPDD